MNRYPFTLRHSMTTILLITWQLAAACSGGGGDDSSSTFGDGAEATPPALTAASTTTDSAGRATATLSVAAGTTKFSVSTESSARYIATDYIRDATGQSYLESSAEFISFAQAYQEAISTANIPSRDFDPTVEGGSFEVSIIAAEDVDSRGENIIPAQQIPVSFTLTSSSDHDLRNGHLRLNVFLVGETSHTEAVQTAASAAIERMVDIYQSQAGISVIAQTFAISGPTKIPFPFPGSSFYLQAAQGSPSPAVNIFIGAEIDFEIDGGTLLGVTASIPGPAFATSKSAVAISAIGSAGPDGEFSESETRIFGETFAHESGHYLGLFHPVELGGLGGFITSGEDSLPDTATCFSLLDCLFNEELVRNLMFPTPLPSGDGETFPQDILTSQQRGVLNLNVIVD